MKVAEIVKGRKISKDVSFVIAPGSRQVLSMLSSNGALSHIINAGARVLECACGPCIGMGQSPATDGISLRTFNRNFKGRSGTPSADIYLVSPEVAAVSAICGKLTDPRDFGSCPELKNSSEFIIDDSLIITPDPDGQDTSIIRGPNIKPFPLNTALKEKVEGNILVKLEDNITTDHIMPSHSKLLPFRSNIEYLADYCLTPCDPDFPKRAKESCGGFVLGGFNFGQGSSREHAALVLLQLGIKAVIARSFARIHMDNLINNGILPLILEEEKDYALIEKGDLVCIENTLEQLTSGTSITLKNVTKNKELKTRVECSDRQKQILFAGGLLNYLKKDN
jgi:aconitate hydratase